MLYDIQRERTGLRKKWTASGTKGTAKGNTSNWKSGTVTYLQGGSNREGTNQVERKQT